MEQHKHEGLYRSGGTLRLHPIRQQHKELSVQKDHNKSLTTKRNKQRFWQGKKPVIKERTNPKPTTPTYKKAGMAKSKNFSKVEEEQSIDRVICQIDGDGFINIDVDSIEQKGVRLKLSRKQTGKKRNIYLTFNK